MTAISIGGATLHLGDCREVLKGFADASVDAIVTDPPYELGFMGRDWDRSGVANDVAMWAECMRVLKPGGHLLAFSGSRTYHRMACAVEGFRFIGIDVTPEYVEIARARIDHELKRVEAAAAQCTALALQQDLFADAEPASACNSAYGLSE